MLKACISVLTAMPMSSPAAPVWVLQVGVAVGQATVTAGWAAAYSLRVWQHSYDGQQWPDAETDLQHGWSAWDHTGRRFIAPPHHADAA